MTPQTEALLNHIKSSTLLAVNVFRSILEFYEVKFAEVIKYQCEEKPHFDEAKKVNPKAQRSVVQALEHTPDFMNESLFIQKPTDFNFVFGALNNLKEIDSTKVKIASYVENQKEYIRVHEALAAVSKVRTKNGIFHIPLLDLDIPIDENGIEKIKEISLGLGIEHAAILNSGRSYHFWGLELLSEEKWRKFMYRALLLDKIDRRWVGHRLIDGHASLRISEKGGKIPVVIESF